MSEDAELAAAASLLSVGAGAASLCPTTSVSSVLKLLTGTRLKTRTGSKTASKKNTPRLIRKKRKVSPRVTELVQETDFCSDQGDTSADDFITTIPCRVADCLATFNSLADVDVHVRFGHNNCDTTTTYTNSTTTTPQIVTPASGANLVTAISNPSYFPGIPAAPSSPTEVHPVNCNECGKFYLGLQALASHQARRHRTTPTQAQPGHKCPLSGCGSPTFPNEMGLVSHLVGVHSFSGKPALPTSSVLSSSMLPGAPETTRPTTYYPTVGSLQHSTAGLVLNPTPPQFGLNALSLSDPSQNLPTSSLGLPANYHSGVMNFHNSQWGNPWSRELKSGQNRTSNPKAKVHIIWPHESFDSVLGQQTFAYNDLTGPALAAGSIASLFHTMEYRDKTDDSVKMFLEHLSFLMHVLSFSDNIQAVLEFHRSVLLLIEAGSLRWSRQFERTLESMRVHFLANLRSISLSTSSSNSRGNVTSNPTKSVEIVRKEEMERNVCFDYQTGSCSKPGDHEGRLHLCKFCWWKRDRKVAHQGNDCPEDPKKKKK